MTKEQKDAIFEEERVRERARRAAKQPGAPEIIARLLGIVALVVFAIWFLRSL